jgi:dihydroorotate dehydrogenase
MLGSQKLFGVSAQLLRQSSGLNRAQWRSLQRQWQRQLSLQSGGLRPSSRTTPYLRVQRRYESTADQAKKSAEVAAQQAKDAAEVKTEQAKKSAESTAEEARRTAQSTAEQAKANAEAAGQQAKQTATNAAVGTVNAGSRVVAWVYGTGLVLLLGFGYLYVTDTRASVHQYLVVPLLRLIHSDAEEAHHAGVRYIKGLYDFNLHIRERGDLDKQLGDLKIDVFGHVLDNPIGTSAGMDKDAEIPSALFALGPAIVEVGGVTPLAQEGNPKPRVFRIPSQNALINRYGLNSKGVEHVAMELRERVRQYAYANGLGIEAESERLVLDGEAGVPPGSLVPGKLLAVQVAKNKTTPDNDIAAIAADYVFGVEHLAKYADIIVVNVSSPNTPGLRDLQAVKPLTTILSSVVDAAKSIDRKTKPAVMVKVSPDEDTDSQVEGICAAVWASGVDGVIVGNTTKKRPDPIPQGFMMPAHEVQTLSEMGGYSGPQMFQRTLDLVKRYRVKLDQGPPAGKQTSTRQQQVQSVVEPSDRKSSPVDESKHLSIADTVQRDQSRLKPDSAEAEEASKRGLIKLPARHTSEEPEKGKYVGQATEHASTTSTAPLDAPREGKASSPREAAEGALQKILEVDQPAPVKGEGDAQATGQAAKGQAQSLANTAKETTQSAIDTAKEKAHSLTEAAKDQVHSITDSAQPAWDAAKAKVQAVTAPPETRNPNVTAVAPSSQPAEKVIFATGGITNGEQCLEILNAGASVCQVYTAMMYGGVGTISRMKQEMREAIKKANEV